MYNLVKQYKKLLDKEKITQRELAKKTKTDVATLEKFVHYGTIKIPILQKIADYFNVPITYFFVDEQQEKDDTFNHLFSQLDESKKEFIIDTIERIIKL